MNIPKNLIQSAQLTAAAWDEPAYVVITKEQQWPAMTGGRMLVARKGQEHYCKWLQQPTVPLLAVLP